MRSVSQAERFRYACCSKKKENQQALREHYRWPSPKATAATASCTGVSTKEREEKNLHEGTLPAFHLMEQPMLGCCVRSTGLPASTASIAARRSRPVTGLLMPGRLSSSCPRYTNRRCASKRKKSGVQVAL